MLKSLQSLKLSRVDWHIVTWVGAALYLILSLTYLFLGQPNADEGWYLYASKLVFKGDMPYRDFAYTQMPLLPYIYGLPQAVFSPSIYLGRATSVLLSITNLLVCLSLARRYAGKMGAGLAALLLGTFTYGIYFESIVKTYALLSLLFTLVLFVLSSNIPDTWKYFLVITLSFCTAMVRLSAVLFLVSIVTYSLAATLRRPITFIFVVTLCITLTMGASFFFVPDLEAAKWNLITHHTSQWGKTSTIGKIREILLVRIPDIIRFFDFYFFPMISFVFLALCNVKIRARIRPYLQRNVPIFVFSIGLALFSISHFGTGSWRREYFVPAVTASLPILSITFSKIYDLHKNLPSKPLIQGIMIATLLLALLHHGVEHIDISGGQLPLEEIREVSAYIASHSEPSNRMFILEALWTAIDSNRTVLPGMTMAQFSLQDMTKEEAAKLRLANSEMTLEYIHNCAARIVVLTEYDWTMFNRLGKTESLRQALLSHYDLVLTKKHFGQHADNVYVYFCRGDSRPSEDRFHLEN